MFFLLRLLCFYALGLGYGKLVRGQDDTPGTGTRLLCRVIPVGADTCLVPVRPETNAAAQEEELRNTVMQLRETILQQKETIVNQLGTINELTAKLSLCESASDGGKYDSAGSWSKSKDNQNTMGDLPRDPNDTIDNLGKTMQSLKDRLENLEVSHGTVTINDILIPKSWKGSAENDRHQCDLNTSEIGLMFKIVASCLIVCLLSH